MRRLETSPGPRRRLSSFTSTGPRAITARNLRPRPSRMSKCNPSWPARRWTMTRQLFALLILLSAPLMAWYLEGFAGQGGIACDPGQRQQTPETVTQPATVQERDRDSLQWQPSRLVGKPIRIIVKTAPDIA